MSNRVYCAVFGCMISSITNPEVTFYRLPGNTERRLQWLQLIQRDDLENKPKFTSYRVCEKHFKVDDALQSESRKRLKKYAVPSLMLPSLASTFPEVALKEDKETQTASSMKDNSTQTDNVTNEIFAQTSTSRSRNTPRKRKLNNDLLQCGKTKKIEETENNTEKAEANTFHQLYDQFLTDRLALQKESQSKRKQRKKRKSRR